MLLEVLATPWEKHYDSRMEYKEYLQFAIKTAKRAGKVLLEYYGKNYRIRYKGQNKNNLVTEVDERAEKLIVEAIQKKYPTHCILAEEGGEGGMTQSEYRWIIDPIDGTTNFAHGYTFFAVSLGLEIKGRLTVGVIYAPYLRELFSAVRGGGAYLNGKKIRVSKVKKIETSLLATGFTYKNRGLNLPNFEHFLYSSQGIRRCGAATLDLCHVAAGRLDGYWELGLRPWDIAAGALIVQEAGGDVTTLDGFPLQLDGESMLATNGFIHSEMQRFFKKQPHLKEIMKKIKKINQV